MLPPKIARTQSGQVCVHVIKRSVRRIPVAGSTWRERVSTATTWEDFWFQGQYFNQFAAETSAQL